MSEGIFRTPETRCPGCGYPLDAASGLSPDDARPTPGDYTVCAECARVLIFNAELIPRDLTPAEQRALEADAAAQRELARVTQALRAYWPKRQEPPT